MIEIDTLIGLENQVLFIGSDQAQDEMIKEFPWFQKVRALPNSDWNLSTLIREELSCCCSPYVFLKRSRKVRALLDELEVQVVFDGGLQD